MTLDFLDKIENNLIEIGVSPTAARAIRVSIMCADLEKAKERLEAAKERLEKTQNPTGMLKMMYDYDDVAQKKEIQECKIIIQAYTAILDGQQKLHTPTKI